MRSVPIDHLPKPLRSAACRLRDWCLGIGPALVILGVGAVARGITYLPPLLNPSAMSGSHPVEGTLSMEVWGWIWIIVGVAALVAAFWGRIGPIAIGAGVGLNLLWGGSFIADAIADESPRGWLPAVGYLSVALLVWWAVWRGQREPTLSREEVAHALRHG